MTTEAQKRSKAQYDAANTKQIKLKLNIRTDADVIGQLDNVKNKQGYIKALIREDIKKQLCEQGIKPERTVTKTIIKTKTYAANDGFYVDIVDSGDLYEAWFYKDGIGVKEYMFGVSKKQTSYDDFVRTVKLNCEDYFENYTEEHDH